MRVCADHCIGDGVPEDVVGVLLLEAADESLHVPWTWKKVRPGH